MPSNRSSPCPGFSPIFSHPSIAVETSMPRYRMGWIVLHDGDQQRKVVRSRQPIPQSWRAVQPAAAARPKVRRTRVRISAADANGIFLMNGTTAAVSSIRPVNAPFESR